MIRFIFDRLETFKVYETTATLNSICVINEAILSCFFLFFFRAVYRNWDAEKVNAGMVTDIYCIDKDQVYLFESLVDFFVDILLIDS